MSLFSNLKNILRRKDNIVKVNNTIDLIDLDRRGEAAYRKHTAIDESEKQVRLERLTAKEYELFLLLVEGFTLKESSGRLLVKYSTVNTHMTSIYKKLEVNSRAELIINYRNTNRTKSNTKVIY